MKTPEEIKRYQKILANKDAILADAQAKAESIINQANIQLNELVSEQEIMKQAYAQANAVVEAATAQAQEILNSATADANATDTTLIFLVSVFFSHPLNITTDPINKTTINNKLNIFFILHLHYLNP